MPGTFRLEAASWAPCPGAQTRHARRSGATAYGLIAHHVTGTATITGPSRSLTPPLTGPNNPETSPAIRLKFLEMG